MSVARRVSSVCVRREKMWVWLAVGVWLVVEEEELELLDEEREEVRCRLLIGVVGMVVVC